MITKIWSWYRDNFHINRTIVAVLFGWQVLHLYWLTTNVVVERLLGYVLFNPGDFYQYLLIVADYFEIPALISGTLLYFYSLREGSVKKNLFFIILINSQWFHLFWITDEFIIDHFSREHQFMPDWLIWLSISIDYLELPVIYDTIKQTVLGFKSRPSQL